MHGIDYFFYSTFTIHYKTEDHKTGCIEYKKAASSLAQGWMLTGPKNIQEVLRLATSLSLMEPFKTCVKYTLEKWASKYILNYERFFSHRKEIESFSTESF